MAWLEFGYYAMYGMGFWAICTVYIASYAVVSVDLFNGSTNRHYRYEERSSD